MPGLKQLKKFQDDVTDLGQETSKRAEREEPQVTYPLPEGISEADDSDDFIFGLPEKETDTEEASADLEPMPDDADGLESSPFADTPQFDTPLSSDENIDFSLPDFDVPDIEALDTFAAGTDNAPAAEDLPDFGNMPASEDLPDFDNAPSADDLPDFGNMPAADDLPDFGNMPAAEDLPDFGNTPAAEDLPDFGNMPATEDLPDFGNTPSAEDLPDFDNAPAADDLPDFDNVPGTQEAAAPADDDFFANAEKFLEPDSQSDAAPAAGQAASPDDIPDINVLDELENLEPDTLEQDSAESEQPGTAAGDTDSNLDFGLNADDFSVPSFDDAAAIDLTSASGIEEMPAMPDAAGEDRAADTGAASPFELDSLPDFDMDADLSAPGVPPEETGDDAASSPSRDIDFLQSLDDIDTTDGLLKNNEAAPEDTEKSDFDLSDFQFNLPTEEKKVPAGGIPQSDSEERRTSLTDAEYQTFCKNIADYPLNLRIAIEDLIVKNEFTDDAVFGVIDKILKKASARQLSAYLEKYLDIHVSVPRDFERRTASQYEAYKSSIEYQLKNRIIPIGVISICLIALSAGLFYLTNRFVYRPLAADKLYKEGYGLLENGSYQQAEIKFAQAVYFKPKKKWFMTYARGYRTEKQYEHAATMYERTLNWFNHDKKAGIEYADMELDDLCDYERAAEILHREVLDYHINDKDALLLLGDTYLEWATEKDAGKFDSAFEQYTKLTQLYGATDVYLGRLLKYHMRTDNLREVLYLKNHFNGKNHILEPETLVELGGYMLEKVYGTLSAADEYLRGSIDGIRQLLNEGVRRAPDIPESSFNLGVYFINSGNNDDAAVWLDHSLELFKNAPERKKPRIYRQIDAYRLLGEIYTGKQEYLQAGRYFADGIELFKTEQNYSSLQPQENIGKLYADFADLDYFISGNLDQAFTYYKDAATFGHDTPSVRYKLGYIQYNNRNYGEALGYFIKTVQEKYDDPNLLLAFANVLSLRDDANAAQGYYEKLLELLNAERAKYDILLPQVRADQGELVDLYMKASNNLGVTLARLAERTGNSRNQARAIVCLSDSIRAYDALTRNPETLVRLDGSNLAAQNLKYISYPVSGYEPAIYTEIARTLQGEKTLKQPLEIRNSTSPEAR